MEDFITFESDNDDHLFIVDERTNIDEYYENLTTVQLGEQLTVLLESINNKSTSNRMHQLIELHKLLLSSEARLDSNQLGNVLRMVGTGDTAYDFHTTTTSMELELHLRIYVLALEACGKRKFKMSKEFQKNLHEHLVRLSDVHQYHIKVIQDDFNKEYTSECNPYYTQKFLKRDIKIQNYNIDFMLVHLHNTLYAMASDEAILF